MEDVANLNIKISRGAKKAGVTMNIEQRRIDMQEIRDLLVDVDGSNINL